MAKNWIAGAIKHPGALKATAQKEGMIKKGGTLSTADIGKLKKSSNPTTAKRANLAQTLMGMHHKKGK